MNTTRRLGFALIAGPSIGPRCGRMVWRSSRIGRPLNRWVLAIGREYPRSLHPDALITAALGRLSWR